MKKIVIRCKKCGTENGITKGKIARIFNFLKIIESVERIIRKDENVIKYIKKEGSYYDEIRYTKGDLGWLKRKLKKLKKIKGDLETKI